MKISEDVPKNEPDILFVKLGFQKGFAVIGISGWKEGKIVRLQKETGKCNAFDQDKMQLLKLAKGDGLLHSKTAAIKQQNFTYIIRYPKNGSILPIWRE